MVKHLSRMQRALGSISIPGKYGRDKGRGKRGGEEIGEWKEIQTEFEFLIITPHVDFQAPNIIY